MVWRRTPVAARIAGGGQTSSGTAMLADNGWQFLLVEGSCVAWILKSHNEPLRTITLSRITGATCNLPPGDALGRINEAFATELAALSAAASEVSGDVRYLVVADSAPGGGDGRPPMSWPLAVPVASLALVRDAVPLENPNGLLPADVF